MKKLLTIGVSVLALTLPFANAQDESDEPTVDISALVIVTGSITSYLQSEASAANCTEAEIEETNSEGEVEVTDSNFDCLLAALEATGLADTLNAEESYTVFAPTDEAFLDYAEESQLASLNDLLADTTRLETILRYHISPANQSLFDFSVGGAEEIETLEGTALSLSFPTVTTQENTTVGVLVPNSFGEYDPPGPQAYVTSDTLSLDNGYIIPISEVLIPPTAETPAAQ